MCSLWVWTWALLQCQSLGAAGLLSPCWYHIEWAQSHRGLMNGCDSPSWRRRVLCRCLRLLAPDPVFKRTVWSLLLLSHCWAVHRECTVNITSKPAGSELWCQLMYRRWHGCKKPCKSRQSVMKVNNASGQGSSIPLFLKPGSSEPLPPTLCYSCYESNFSLSSGLCLSLFLCIT